MNGGGVNQKDSEPEDGTPSQEDADLEAVLPAGENQNPQEEAASNGNEDSQDENSSEENVQQPEDQQDDLEGGSLEQPEDREQQAEDAEEENSKEDAEIETDADSEDESLEQVQEQEQEGEGSGGMWQEPETRDVVENYRMLTVGQPLTHTSMDTEQYVFQPEESGWYLLSVESGEGCTFRLSSSTNWNYYIYGRRQIDRVMWLSKDESYSFDCGPDEYENSQAIHITLTVKQTGIDRIESIQNPTEASYDSLDLQGAKVRIFLTDGSIIDEEIRQNNSYPMNGMGGTNYYIDTLSWNGIAQSSTEPGQNFDGFLRIQQIDGQELTQGQYETFDSLDESTEHKAKLCVMMGQYDIETGQWNQEAGNIFFEVSFTVLRTNTNIESLTVIDSRREYTENLGEFLEPIKILVTYKDGTPDKVIDTTKTFGVRQYLSYGDGQETTSIDIWAQNNKGVEEATVTVFYKGKTVPYQINIKQSPYERIEIEAKKKIYYIGCSIREESGFNYSDWISQTDFSATITYKEGGKTEYYDSLSEIPDCYFGIKSEGREELYQNIDEYIENGGSAKPNVECTFQWRGLTTSCSIEIRENPYQRIEMTAEPVKKIYQSNEALQLDGLQFRAYKNETDYDEYIYGEPDGKAIADWQSYFHTNVDGYGSIEHLGLGLVSIPLYFMGKEITSYGIEIKESLVKRLNITQTPDRIEYAIGENNLDYTGLAFEVEGLDGGIKGYRYWTWPNGPGEGIEYDNWTEISHQVFFDTSQINWNQSGSYPVTMSYLGASISFQIEVKNTPVTALEILKAPDQTTFFQYEENETDLRGLKYRVTFEDKSVKEDTVQGEQPVYKVPIRYQGIEYQLQSSWLKRGSDGKLTKGENTLILSLLGKSASVNSIMIQEDPIQSLKLISNPEKMQYRANDRTPDLYGAVIEITYKNGVKKQVAVQQHTGQITVDDNYQKLLYGNLSPRDEAQGLYISYMNIRNEYVLEMPYTFASEAEPLTKESLFEVELTKERPYRVYSFTPEQTGMYYFYRTVQNDGPVSYLTELYQGNTNCTMMMGVSVRIEYELKAGSTYYYTVGIDDGLNNIEEPIHFQCCFSSEVSDLSMLNIKGFQVRPPKDIWYDFEPYFPVGELGWDLTGTQVQITYENGWKENIVIPYGYGEVWLHGKELRVEWKYTVENDGELYVDTGRENALVYTWGDFTKEVIAKSFHEKTPVASVEIVNNPLEEKQYYQYQLEAMCEEWYGQEGLTAIVHYKDGRPDDTLSWRESEGGWIYEPELNGYRSSASIKKELDSSGKETGNYVLSIKFMGVSVQERITALASPVSDLEIMRAPEKMCYYPFEEGMEPDLYGLKLKITYKNGRTREEEVTTHTYEITVKDENEAALSGYLDETDGSMALYLKYMGFKKQVGEYVRKPFTEIEGVQTIQIGENKTVNLNEGIRYQIYQFTPPDAGTYVLTASDGNEDDNYAEVYSAAGVLLAYDDDGAGGLDFKLTYTMMKGKTYYFLVRMNAIGATGSFTCTLTEGEPVLKQTISQMELQLAAPEAGKKFPSYWNRYDEFYIELDAEWYGDEDNDGCADYAASHRVKLLLAPYTDYQFTPTTQVTVNGKRITAKSIGADGRMTVYYTFPPTDCRVTVPDMEGYDLDQTMNSNPGAAEYNGSYSFRYTKKNSADTKTLIVKANDQVLTPDAGGLYTLTDIRENITVYVKTDQTEAAGQESKLTLHNKSQSILDILIGKQQQTLSDNNCGEKTLPVLESYAGGSDQFFYGWYMQADPASLNGKGTRFTSKRMLTQAQYDLYAKWSSGIFAKQLNGKPVNYKILSIDEENRIKVQVGDGSNQAARAAANLMKTRAFATRSGVLEIPGTLPVKEIELQDQEIHLTECQVVAIADRAFAGEEDITSVVLPDTIETIGAHAFGGSGLTEIQVPESVSSIGAGAFSGCQNLQSVILPSTITEIPQEAFNDCTSLSSVTIPEGVSNIGSSAFAGCTSLNEVTLPDTIETIEPDAFPLPAEGKNLTIYCSSETAQTETVQTLKENTGATVTTVDIELNYLMDEKIFIYGDAAQTFCGSVKIKRDGAEETERKVTWNLNQPSQGAAYQTEISADGASVAVAPLRVLTQGEHASLTATDAISGKTRTIALTTQPFDLQSVDADQDPLCQLEVVGADNLIYSGTEIRPQVTVRRVDTNAVIPAENYQLSYSKNMNAGKASVTAEGTGNYCGALSQAFTIQKKAQTITAPNQNKTVGDPDFMLGAQTDGGGALTYSSAQPAVASVDAATGKVSVKSEGTATITILAAESENYLAGEKTVTITVKKKAQPETPGTGTQKPGGDSSTQKPDGDSGTQKPGGDSNTQKPGTGTTTKPQKKAQTITAASFTKKMGDAAFSLKVKTNGNGALSYTSKNTKVAKVDKKGKVTIVGVGTAQIVIKASETSTCKAASKTIKITVKKGSARLKVKKTSYTKAKGSKTFSLGATAKTTLKFKSSNTKVAKVSKKGKVTLVGCGTATITVSAAGTNKYTKASKKVTIKVVPKTAKIKSVKSKKAGQLTVSWNRQKEADGYVVQYSTDKKFKKKVQTKYVKKNKTTSLTLKKLQKGKKYYVRVKAYKTISKKKAYGTASKAVVQKVKK